MNNSFNIVDEHGNNVSNEFLNEILKISSSPKDFLEKVNYGITEHLTRVSIDNDLAILNWYTQVVNGYGKMQKIMKLINNAKPQ